MTWLRLICAGAAAVTLFVGPPLSASRGIEPSAPQCSGAEGYSEDFHGRRTFLWRPQWLETLAADENRSAALIEAAETALARGPYSVTDKKRLVPGAGPHDYTSIGPYWWPDPSKDDGLPYIRRDGVVNPERNGADFDKVRMRNLGHDLEALAVGYYLSGDERFAEHAAMLIRTWFIDPSTRMAPNMNFAQGIPGRVQGRGEGIIEASDLSTVIESLGLLAPSGAISDEELSSIRNWYAQFASWMATSDLGTDEMRKRNNHGVFYDFYLAHFALFAGLESVTNNIASSFAEIRLGTQMDRQGRFLAELGRTRSWHYSNYIVSGAGRLATISECVGVDLWNATLQDGRGLLLAHEFLLRYSSAVEAWPFKDDDHAAGRFERMRRAYRGPELLFGRGDTTTVNFELP